MTIASCPGYAWHELATSQMKECGAGPLTCYLFEEGVCTIKNRVHDFVTWLTYCKWDQDNQPAQL